MSDQRRRSQSAKKQLSEKQLVIAQRSRSIKASLLRILSIDVAALYHINSQRENGNPLEAPVKANRAAQVTRIVNQTDSSIEDQAIVHEDYTELYHSLPSENVEKQSLNSVTNPVQSSNLQFLNRQVDESQREPMALLLISRLIAFFIGLLIHHGIHFYFSSQSVALSGLAFSAKRNCKATAFSGVSVLVTVIIMLWNRKLLWNLCSSEGCCLQSWFYETVFQASSLSNFDCADRNNWIYDRGRSINLGIQSHVNCKADWFRELN